MPTRPSTRQPKRRSARTPALRAGAAMSGSSAAAPPGAGIPTILSSTWFTTLFARNPDTGQAAWAYQMTPHDAWDYDGINESVLTDSTIDGNTVPTLTHFDRNGFAYVMDRRNGKLLKANKFDASTNWAKEIDLRTGKPQ